MPNLRLESPHAGLIDSYRALVDEFVEREEALVPFPLAFDHRDVEAFIAQMQAFARGENLPPGFVAHSTWWLVRDGVEVVGVSNLRHALTDGLRIQGGHIGYGVRPSARRQGCATALLRATLGRAAGIGIDEALLTCAAGNEGSIATILRCGGVWVSEDHVAARGARVRRYLVATDGRGDRVRRA